MNHKWKGLIRIMNNYNKNPSGQLIRSYFALLFISKYAKFNGFLSQFILGTLPYIDPDF
jgi:hypothetical protein